MRIQHDKVVDAVTFAADGASGQFDISDMKDVAIVASWAGDVDGSWQLEVSLNGSDWISKDSAVTTGGDNGSASWEIANNPWKLARISLGSSSTGSSDLTVERCGKAYD